MAEQLFISQGEVNKIFGHIPSRTLRFWVESGLVEWAKEHEDGRGKHKLYSFKHLVQLRLVSELMTLKMPVKIVKGIMLLFHGGSFKNMEDLTLLLGKEKHIDLGKRKQRIFKNKIDDKAGENSIKIISLPGWHYIKLLRKEDIGKELDQNINDLILLVMVNLKNIIETVKLHIMQAAA